MDDRGRITPIDRIVQSLHDRLRAAGECDDRLDAANAAAELEALEALRADARRLAESGNYVADREVYPSCVWFRNGRKVVLRTEVKGGRIIRAWLDVERTGVMEVQADAIDAAMNAEGDTDG